MAVAPKISVIIPAFNAERWIEDAVRSVATQSLPAHEIIVVDGASSDRTGDIVRHLQPFVPQLILVEMAAHRGPAVGRNMGIDRATGEWMAFLDADDWYAPTRLATLVRRAERVGANIVADNQVLTTGLGDVSRRVLFRNVAPSGEMIDLGAFLSRDGFTGDGAMGLIKPMFRSAFLEVHGLRYDEDPAIALGEDSLFYLRCLLTGESILLEGEPLYFYRQHAHSLSRNATASAVAMLKEKSLEILRCAQADTSPALARAIDRRMTDLDSMAAYREVMEAAITLRPGELVKCLWRNRRRMRFFLRRAARSFAKRSVERWWRRRSARPKPNSSVVSQCKIAATIWRIAVLGSSLTFADVAMGLM